jgi:CHAD domain-containing protein
MPRKAEGDSPLLKYLDSLVEDLRNLVSPAVRGEDVEAVHDARVATRRLKAATGLVGPAISNRCRKPFDRTGKLLRRRLGPLRDLDVMLEHLAELKQPPWRRGVEWLRQRLEERRAEAVESARDETPPARMLARLGSWWGLRHDIGEACEAIDELLTQSVHLQLDAFAEQAGQLAPGEHGDPHQLRIAGKSLRYTLELAKANGTRLPAAVGSLFKRMQTALGLWHDYVVLTERMLRETVDCDLALHDPELQRQILALAQITLRKAQAQLRKMSTLWKSRGPWLTQTIRQTFPLTKPAAADELPLKPAADEASAVPVDRRDIPAA